MDLHFVPKRRYGINHSSSVTSQNSADLTPSLCFTDKSPPSVWRNNKTLVCTYIAVSIVYVIVQNNSNKYNNVEIWLRDINRLFYELQQHVYIFVCSACVYMEGF